MIGPVVPSTAFWGGTPVASFGLLFVSGVAVSNVRYANHDLLAILLPTLVLMFALFHLLKPSGQEVRRWGMLSLAIVLFAFGARAANMFVMDPVCKICRWGIPYADLANEIRSGGIGPSEIIAFEPELAGNLRMQFPSSRINLVRLARLPSVAPQSAGRDDAGGGKRLIVWQVGGRRGINETPQGMIARLRAAGITAQPVQVKAAWRHMFRPTGYRHTIWNYVVID